MHEIPMDTPSREFRDMWSAAGRHLNAQVKQPLSWLRAHLNPPFLEHLSFRLGNQLFFVRVLDVAGVVEAPGAPHGLEIVARRCNGVPCWMSMRRRLDAWEPANIGWGLVHAATRKAVTPPELVTDEPIEMTDWELHDFGVQIVRDELVKQGRQLMSAQSNPDVDPGLWFVGDDGPEWVVVRCVRYPTATAPLPSNIAAIAAQCARLSPRGNFASVSVANAAQMFETNAMATPLWRGHGMFVSYSGLQSVAR